MAESNRKCSRLGEWFVQEEIARAIDTALETIIGLSKRKQFKYHGGESLFALDFHTERRTSSLLPLVFFPPSSYLRGELTRGLHHYHPKVCCHVRAAWLASGLCVWRHTKWNSLCVSLYCMCVCVCLCRRESLLYFLGIWSCEEGCSQTERVCFKAKSLLFTTLIFWSTKTQRPAPFPVLSSFTFMHIQVRSWPEDGGENLLISAGPYRAILMKYCTTNLPPAVCRAFRPSLREFKFTENTVFQVEKFKQYIFKVKYEPRFGGFLWVDRIWSQVSCKCRRSQFERFYRVGKIGLICR